MSGFEYYTYMETFMHCSLNMDPNTLTTLNKTYNFEILGKKCEENLLENNQFITYLVAQMAKNLPALWEARVLTLGQEDPLEEGMATHSSILARIPWAEEPGGLQFMGSQRVGHNWVTNTFTFHLRYFLVVWPFQSLVPWLLSVNITLDMSYSGDWNVLWRMIIYMFAHL